MNIVIIGASDIGIHLATTFSEENDRVILVDKDPRRLEKVGRELDIGTREGLGTDWELLEELFEFRPDLLIALTHDDETNLVICTIAKHLGYPRTVARVRKHKYLLQSRLNFEQLFCVDHLISPEWLTAEAISNMVLSSGSLSIESFSHGLVQMRTLQIPNLWRKEGIPLSSRELLEMPDDFMIGLIKRDTPLKSGHMHEHIIFPHGEDFLLPGDEVTVVGLDKTIQQLHRFFGITVKVPRSVLIVGGSLIGINVARALHKKHVSVMIMEKDYDKCAYLSEILPQSTIVHRDGTDFRFMMGERVGEFDAVIACTRDDEVNFLVGTLARELGVETVICSLSDTSYLPLLKKHGITFAASPRLRTTNRILSIAQEQSLTSMVSLYNHAAKVVEIKISNRSKIVGIPIKHLAHELPKELIILTILSRGRVMIAHGSRVLSPGDTIVVMTSPQYTKDLKRLF